MTTAARMAFDKWWSSSLSTWAHHAKIAYDDAYSIYLQSWGDALQCEIDRLESEQKEETAGRDRQKGGMAAR